MTDTRRTVIVGGGASGVLAAIALLRTGTPVTIVDSEPRLGAGVAYRTTSPYHLLNSPAKAMSAVAELPDDFVGWAGLANPDSFQPRWIYQRYLAESLEAADGRNGELNVAIGRAVSVHPGERGTTVRLDNGQTLTAAQVVLALGYRPPGTPHAIGTSAQAGGRYFADPWRPGVLHRLRPGEPVLLIGTGLTAIDMAMSIHRRDPDARIYCVSRHGLLPAAHPWQAAPPVTPLLPAPTSTRQLLHATRELIARCGDWQPVVDGLRSAAAPYWAALPEPERQRFLRHVNRHWQVHRHRMAPAIASAVGTMRGSGTLTVLAGQLRQVEPAGTGLTSLISTRSGGLTAVHCGAVLNCTGPGSAATGADPLVRFLRTTGLARLDPLATGFDVTADGALIGAGNQITPSLWTLGPPRLGTSWETTAVPEIRAQAAALATAIAERPVRSTVEPPRQAIGTDSHTVQESA